MTSGVKTRLRESAAPDPVTLFAPPAPVPLAFGPAARRLFGWYHPAAPGRRQGPGVVLCPPVGYEALCTHASYRVFAERLAEEGFPALRFDYDGTGDSIGSDEDDDRVQSWLASIGFAIDALRERSGVADVSLFGVRLGATLAVVAAAERGDVQDLLLWAPCRTGRSYLREMRVLQAGHRRSEPGRPNPSEYEEAAGFIFMSPTVAALNRLDASSLSHRPASRALLIGRDDLPDDERLAARIAALGTAVTLAPLKGYAAMMRDAQDTEIPQSAIGSIIEWLESHAGPGGKRRIPSVRPMSFPTEAAESPPLATESYTEEPVLWGTSPRTFGILTRPRADSRRGRTVILLLNVGANHHIGPNRMYVALARQLAAQGFSVFRLDVPGMGDSACGSASARGQIYSASAVQHVREMIAHLETHLGAERFVLVGLCSGAYMAYQVASVDPRVTTQILINPQTFAWNEGDSLEILTRANYKPTHHYLTGLNDGDVWKRLLNRQIDVEGIAKTLWKRLLARCGVALKSLLSLTLRLKPFETHVRQTLRLIADRGTDTLFIFAAEDVGIEVTALHLGTDPHKIRRRKNAWKNLWITTVEEADHTFTQKAARETMLSLIVQHLTRRYPDGRMVPDDECCGSEAVCRSPSSQHPNGPARQITAASQSGWPGTVKP